MHVIPGELRKDTFEKQLDGSYMFVIELSEFQKDKDDQPIYTNYKAAFFAKSQAAFNHFKKAFVKGNYVVVSCEKLKVEVSDCGQYTKLDMCFPKLQSYKECNAPSQQQQSQQQQQQGGFNQQPQQQGGFAPQQQQGGFAPQQNQNPQF
ncbi:hypothetical protein [Pseudoalteromonas sp.]|uniref:hypothetical protein n=1 Tax=Pseudoalteromonas sp. TaxID=53249 RepID=UPI003D11725F